MSDLPTPDCFHDDCPGCANPGHAVHACPTCEEDTILQCLTHGYEKPL